MKKRICSLVLIFAMLAMFVLCFSEQMVVQAASNEVIENYDVYLAEYLLSGFPYEYNVNQFKLPYRSVIEQNKNSTAYQGLYVAWYTATFQASDLIKLSQKKYTLNEAMLYDILFLGCDESEYFNNLEKDIKDTQISFIKDIFIELQKSDLDKTSEEFKTLEKSFSKINGTNPLSDITKDWLKTSDSFNKLLDQYGFTLDYIFTAFSTSEEIFNSLAKIEVINSRMNADLRDVLVDLCNADVPDNNLAAALEKLVETYDSKENLNMIKAGVIAHKTIRDIYSCVLDELASRLLDECIGAGFLVSGAQQLGKTFSAKFIYSADEEFELYDKMTTLYTFEDHLKNKIRIYANNYRNNKSVKNAKKLNASIDLLMNTYLLGMDYADKYLDVTYNSGALNKFLHSFKNEEYEKHKKSLQSIRNIFESEISFYKINVRNMYTDRIREYYSKDLEKNADDYVELTKTQNPISESGIAELLNQMKDICFEYSNLSINKEFKLTRNMHTYGNMEILSYDSLDLNGHTLTVDGDCTVDGGTISFNGGTLTVGSNMTLSGCYALDMSTVGDTLTVKGNLTTKVNGYGGHGSNYANGTFILHGNWTNNDGGFYKDVKVRLLGSKNVTIGGNGSIKISSLYVQNSESRKISIKTDISTKLESDIIVADNLHFNTDSPLDLNGHTLTVDGDCTVDGGTISFNGGTLTVGSNMTLSGCYALDMSTVGDTLTVKGNLTTKVNGYGGHGSNYANGTFILHGNWTNNDGKFYKDVKVRLLGSKNVTIGGNGSIKISSLYVQNSESRKISIKTDISTKLKSDITVADNPHFCKDSSLDMNGHKLTVDGDCTVDGGTISFNGGTLIVDGDCTVDGGSISFNGGTLTVGGNMTLGGSYKLNMLTIGDTLTVEGNLTTKDNNYWRGNLSSGIFNLYGDWTNNDGEFYKDVKVRLLGSKNVTIGGNGSIEISSLYVQNSESRKISIKTDISTKLESDIIVADNPHFNTDSSLDLNGHKLTVDGDCTVDGGTISFNGGTLTVDGDCTVDGGTISFNGGTLIVDGDCTVDGGSISFNGGTLTVGGNMTLGGSYKLNMSTVGDTLTVKGNLTTEANGYWHGNLSSGIFNLYGDWTNNDGGFSEDVKVRLLGSKNVTINGSGSISIPSLYIEKSYARTVSMNGIISAKKLTGGNINITAIDKPTLKFDSVQNGVYVKGKADLSITDGVLSSIAVATLPTKMNYNVNEVFDSKGLVLKAVYADGSVKKLTSDYVCTPSGKLTVSGQQKITVTYAGKQTYFNVTVNGAVSITTQPTNKTVKQGDSVTFSLKAEGSDLTYQWQLSDDQCKTWRNSKATTASYSATVTDSNNGRYVRCIVTDKYGNKVTSNAAYMKITSLKITTQPASATVKNGAMASFKVVATGPSITYQWQLSDDQGKTWRDSSNKTATYSTTLSDKNNGRYVRCVVTDKYGNSLKSNAAYMKITSLKITTQPASATVKNGATASFKVVATGPSITYQWQLSDDQGKTWRNSKATTANYSATVTDSNNGRYVRCIVTDKYGNSVKSNATYMKITSLKITSQPVNAKAAKGGTVTFKVVATGPSITYQWQLSDDQGKTWRDSSNKTATYSTTLSDKNNGRYVRCVVTDKYGNSVKSNAAIMKVK